MYIGRIVCIALTGDGRLSASYRVSSRSFPNRTTLVGTDRVSIVPKPGHEADVQKNPYVSYNCVRLVADGEVAVVTNGSQTDPIAEKIAMGMTVRDALALSLLALDYEKDAYNTPRICAVADRRNGMGWLGVVREDGLEVDAMPLQRNRFYYVATYEESRISLYQSGDYTASDADEACAFVLSGGIFAERTHPVAAVAAVAGPQGFDIAVRDA